MRSSFRGVLLLAGLSLFSLLLSGCFLRGLTGNVSGDLENATVHIQGTSVTSDCNISSIPGKEGTVSCFYIIDWDPLFELESTFVLIEEFGLFGVLVDPLILQVPEDAYLPQGTFTDTSTSSTTDIVITETTSFNVQPGQVMNAEPGQKFFILEFPDGTDTDDVEYDFDFTFFYPEVVPITVKAMFTGRIDFENETYYIPLLPCAQNFSDAFEFTLQITPTAESLMPDLADYAQQNEDIGCDGQVYGPASEETPTPTLAATPEPTPAPTATPTPSPTATPTPGPALIQGDIDCDEDVDAVDGLKTLQEIANLDYSQESGCPAIGGAIPAGGATPLFGDTDCDGDVDAVDALQILRHVAGLTTNQEEGCTEVGDELLE